MKLKNSPLHVNVPTPLAELNVTPLVDIVLVLLIIFMVSVPLMQHGIQVELPRTQGSSLEEKQKPIFLIIDASEKITFGDQPQALTIHQLPEKLTNPKAEIFLQADQKLPWGFVAKVTAILKKAGIQRIAFMTLPETQVHPNP